MPITDFVDTSHPHIPENQITEGDIGEFDKTAAAGGIPRIDELMP
jgi:hypothetical protein